MDSLQPATKRFLALIPPPIPIDLLEDYGLQVTIPQAEALSMEILSLTMFWVKHALSAGIPADYGKRLWREITESVAQDWERKFGFESLKASRFFQEMDRQHTEWGHSQSQGPDPITLFTYAINKLDAQGLLPSGEQGPILALFLDFVPVGEIGEVASGLEQG